MSKKNMTEQIETIAQDTTPATTVRPVLVTTAHRGVFAGILAEDTNFPKSITLTDARNCLFWHQDIGGFLGLASVGPNSQCKIGAVAPRLILVDITSMADIAPAAWQAWGEWKP